MFVFPTTLEQRFSTFFINIFLYLVQKKGARLPYYHGQNYKRIASGVLKFLGVLARNAESSYIKAALAGRFFVNK